MAASIATTERPRSSGVLSTVIDVLSLPVVLPPGLSQKPQAIISGRVDNYSELYAPPDTYVEQGRQGDRQPGAQECQRDNEHAKTRARCRLPDRARVMHSSCESSCEEGPQKYNGEVRKAAVDVLI